MAEAFSIDPIQVLNSDVDEWLIRVAAAHALARDREDQDKKRRNVSGGY